MSGIERQSEQTQLFAKQAWEAFASGKSINPEHIEPHLLRAWEHSRSCGVDPYCPQVPHVITGKQLARLRQENSALLASAEPMLGMLEVSIRNTGYIATLAIASGYLLAVVGDDTLMSQAERVYNVAGALRSIEAVGASALTLCITEKRPLQITGYEHYNLLFHEWKCAGAPIYDSEGTPIASLTISGHLTRKDHHTLALVKSCAEVITIRLRENALLLTQQRLNSMLRSVYNSLPEATLAIGQNNIITHANHSARSFLSEHDINLEGKNIDELIAPESVSRVHSILQRCKPETCELPIRCSEGSENRTCRFTPIRLDNGMPCGMTLTITPRSQLIDIAKHVGGNYAKYSFSDIKGKNAALLVQIDLARRAAATGSRVLLTGESGTGKELFAQSIHNSSAMRNGPFVAISCAAIPRDLIESELFGYVGGAFTGAREKGMIGKVELAAGGTLFLDEINSLPLEMQAKLLRSLQQREIVRIGDTKPTTVNARIIAATNINLMDAIQQGSFREDLYYRLNVVEIIIPPLRERKDDIELLINLILRRQSVETHLPVPHVAPEVIQILLDYSWPGNIRELDNVCERALLLSGGEKIIPAHLPKSILEAVKSPYSAQYGSVVVGSVKQTYRDLILNTLNVCQGNLSQAADRLGIARSTLYRNMRKYDIDPRFLQK